MNEETLNDRTKEEWWPFFATCAAGTELVLKDELRELRFRKVRADRGGVRFEGPWRDGFRACLMSRIAIRILALIQRFPAKSSDELYEGVHAIEWERWLSPHHTLSVSAISKTSQLTHTNFIAQRTKDGIVDRLREREGARPSVDRDNPDLAVFVHLAKDEAGVHLDLGGESLHRRGYRTEIGEAPLKETLAAAMLRLSSWDRQSPLIDPLCGSGTIPIEADLWTRHIAPGRWRERFGIERWASHDEREQITFRAIRDDIRAIEQALGPDISGTDDSSRAIDTARANARRAGARAHFSRRSLRDFQASSEPSLIIANPPYGVRIDPRDFYRELDRALPRMQGHQLGLLLYAPPPRELLPEPKALHPLWNGALECRFALWDL